MSNHRMSDLPMAPGFSHIVVMQPRCTRSYSAKPGRTSVSPKDFQQIYREISIPLMRHYATISVYNNDPGSSRPVGIKECGGNVRFVLGQGLDEQTKILHQHCCKFKVICDNPACGLKLGIHVSLPDPDQIFFYLMYKQLLPKASFCNYLDCNLAAPDLFPMYNHRQYGVLIGKLKNIGLVAVQADYFMGFLGETHQVGNLSLGFIMMPGMDTYEDPFYESFLDQLHQLRVDRIKGFLTGVSEGINGWKSINTDMSRPPLNRQLVTFDRYVKDASDQLSGHLLGPKPAKGSRIDR